MCTFVYLILSKDFKKLQLEISFFIVFYNINLSQTRARYIKCTDISYISYCYINLIQSQSKTQEDFLRNLASQFYNSFERERDPSDHEYFEMKNVGQLSLLDIGALSLQQRLSLQHSVRLLLLFVVKRLGPDLASSLYN